MSWRRSSSLRVGIVGCGAIGGALARWMGQELNGVMQVTALTDLDAAKAKALSEALAARPSVLPLTQLIRRVQLVIEAASANVSFHIAQQVLEAGRDCLVMSVGGLLGRYDALVETARKHQARLWLPSGALAGLDGIKAFRGAIRRVTLTSRKPPQSLAAAPYVRERHLQLDALQQDTAIFEGNAQDAVIGFPQNANVAATVALCSGVPELLRVQIIAAPRATTNSHEVQVEGAWGSLMTRLESQPSTENPKTSQAAIASAQAVLREWVAMDRVGT